MMSRTKALKLGRGRDIISELGEKGIIVMAKGRKTVYEEMPEAYKLIDDVVDVVHNAGIANKVARLRPIGVIKG
jgi:tRNA-splicing ligase RtcB